MPPTKRARTQQEGRVKDVPVPRAPKLKADRYMWKCKGCGHANVPSAKVCGLCETRRSYTKGGKRWGGN